MSLICAPSSLLLSVIYCFLSNYFRILYLFCACDVVRCSSCLCCCFLLLLFFCFLCPSVFHMCSITVLLLSHCFLFLFLCTSVFLVFHVPSLCLCCCFPHSVCSCCCFQSTMHIVPVYSFKRLAASE